MQRTETTRAVDGFLSAMTQGPRGLVVEGEPGIGKTTMASSVASQARQRDARVVPVHVGRPETALSFAALGDLLDAVPDDVPDRLPEPQRDALAITMLRAPGEEVRQDPRAVSLATLAVVRDLAQRPLLLVIDDLQWLDASSARVFSFVLQRLEREPVGVLATLRSTERSALPLDLEHDLAGGEVQRLQLGPMPPAGFIRLLRTRVDPDLPRSVALQIHEAVEGNPFYGLELAREVVAQGLPEPGTPLPLPPDELEVVQRRLSQLSSGARAVLTAAALTSRPQVAVLTQAMFDVDVSTALAEAELADLVVVEHGRVTFRHAIFASALVARTPGPERRAAHRLLATAAESPEERARHLALSSLEPDAAIADALADARDVARRRGATVAAADLAALAEVFTPEAHDAARLQRAVAAGMLAFEAGDAASGQEKLRRLVARTPSGPERAEVMVTLCEICWQDTTEVEALSTAALAEPGVDPATVAAAHLMLAWVGFYRGRLADAQGCVDRAAALVTLSEEDRATRSDLLTIAALTAYLTGRPHHDLIEEAVTLEDLVATRSGPTTTIYSGARVTRGLIALLAAAPEAARSHLVGELERLNALGRYVARDEILCYLSYAAWLAGDWSEASAYVEESLEIGVESGHRLGFGQNVLPRALVAAGRGELDSARADAEEGLALSLRYRDEYAAATARRVLGLVALTEGDPASAVEHFRPMVRFLQESGGCWPIMTAGVADALQALTAVGAVDEAEAILARSRLTCAEEPWREQRAVLARGEAAVAAVRGDLDEAAQVLSAALADPALSRQPFELARTHLAAGELHRRRRSRATARTHLEQALRGFTDLGAAPWAERAQRDLGRLDGAGGHGELTPTETELVRLLASGLKNRELAGALFVSVKTVEANLSHIYRRTGLRSRQELVRWWVAREGSTEP